MSWRDDLRPASFRGVPFKVLPLTTQVGRRTVLHEYPQRDKPYGEDLGKKARQYQVDAIVLGADYLTQRNRLIAALEAKGPGKLVHPTLGEMDVILTSPASVTEDFGKEGGSARFSMTFVEAGDIAALTVTADTSQRAGMAADSATSAAQTAFEKALNLGAGGNNSLLGQVLGALNGTTGTILSVINGIKNFPASMLADVNSLITAATGDYQQILSALSSLSGGFDLGALGSLFESSPTGTVSVGASPATAAAAFLDRATSSASTTTTSPSALAQALTSSVQTFQGTATSTGGLDGVVATTREAGSAAAQTPMLAIADAMPAADGSGGAVQFAPIPQATTDLGVAQDTNRQAMTGLVRQIATIEAVRVATDRDTGYSNANEVQAVRDGLVARLDAEMMASTDHDLNASLRQLRAALVTDLDSRAAALPALRTVASPTVQPALVLAHRYYDDPARAADLVAQNDVAHPGFVRAGRLIVDGGMD